ncbi:MAG: right-handed parallel beta-helix repeat-containing protein, partial [Solirubrobacteraceae bacterium]
SVGAGTFKEDIVIDKALTIEGASGGTSTTIEGSGEDSAAVTVEANVHATLSQLAIRDSEGTGVEYEGATASIIDSTITGSRDGVGGYGTFAITDSTITGNSTGVEGYGSVAITGSRISDNSEYGLDGGGSLTIADSTFEDNEGQAVYADFDSESLTITASTISHNGSGIESYETANTTITGSTISENEYFGVYSVGGTTTIAASTISHNGGEVAPMAGDGGVFAQSATIAITASTISANWYGVLSEGPGASVTVADSTVSGNQRYGAGSVNGASTVLAASVVAGNGEQDCSSSVTDDGYNVASDATCGFSAPTSISNSPSIDLGPLTNNGGPTETELPGAGSVLLERIPAAASAEIDGKRVALCEGTTDQRGIPRPSLAGASCDVGAVELLAGSTTTLSAAPASATAGEPVTLTATVAAAPGTPALPAPAGGVSFALEGGGTIAGCEDVPLASVEGALRAKCTTSALPTGPDALAASYRPSNDYHPSTGTSSVTVAAPAPPSGSGSGGGSGGVKGFSSHGTTASVPIALSALRVSPATFLAAASGPSATAKAMHTAKGRKRTGARVSFTLNEPATVRFKVTRRVSGRIARGGRCVAQTAANRHARACKRTVTLAGSFARAGVEGANSFHFSGRLAGRRLAPGSYLLLATPSEDGHRGRTRSVAFKILG